MSLSKQTTAVPSPALLTDVPPSPRLLAYYIGPVALYGIVYTGIVLLFGLILFEDRDLA